MSGKKRSIFEEDGSSSSGSGSEAEAEQEAGKVRRRAWLIKS